MRAFEIWIGRRERSVVGEIDIQISFSSKWLLRHSHTFSALLFTLIWFVLRWFLSLVEIKRVLSRNCLKLASCSWLKLTSLGRFRPCNRFISTWVFWVFDFTALFLTLSTKGKNKNEWKIQLNKRSRTYITSMCTLLGLEFIKEPENKQKRKT